MTMDETELFSFLRVGRCSFARSASAISQNLFEEAAINKYVSMFSQWLCGSQSLAWKRGTVLVCVYKCIIHMMTWK